MSPLGRGLKGGAVVFMRLGITGLGVGMGALDPRFHVENAAQISVSYGGVVYMVLSMIFVAVAVVLLVTPTSAIFSAQVNGEAVSGFLWWALAAAMGIVTVMSLLALFIPIRLGIRNLKSLEVYSIIGGLFPCVIKQPSIFTKHCW